MEWRDFWQPCPSWVVGTLRLRRSITETNHNARNDKPDEWEVFHHDMFINVIEKHDSLCLIFYKNWFLRERSHIDSFVKRTRACYSNNRTKNYRKGRHISSKILSRTFLRSSKLSSKALTDSPCLLASSGPWCWLSPSLRLRMPTSSPTMTAAAPSVAISGLSLQLHLLDSDSRPARIDAPRASWNWCWIHCRPRRSYASSTIIGNNKTNGINPLLTCFPLTIISGGSRFWSVHRLLHRQQLRKFLLNINSVSSPSEHFLPTKRPCCGWLHPYHHQPLGVGQGGTIFLSVSGSYDSIQGEYRCLASISLWYYYIFPCTS